MTTAPTTATTDAHHDHGADFFDHQHHADDDDDDHHDDDHGDQQRGRKRRNRGSLGVIPNHVLPTGPPWRLGDETPPSHPKEEPDDIAPQREDVS